MLYDRLMGTSSALDDQYYAEELAQGRPGPATGLVPASKPPVLAQLVVLIIIPLFFLFLHDLLLNCLF